MQAYHERDVGEVRQATNEHGQVANARRRREQALTAGEATRLDSHVSRHTYHGHRRNSFVTKDIDELTELRARREHWLPSV